MFYYCHKTIQLSSHITQHDEFIKATLSSEIFFETNNIFAIRGKNPFHYVRQDKKLHRVELPYVIAIKQAANYTQSNPLL